MLTLIDRAIDFASRTAIGSDGQTFSYQELLDQSAALASTLLAGKTDLEEARVAFMVDPGFQYVVTQWAIWRAGGIAVPLCTGYPLNSLAYVIEDSDADLIVADGDYYNTLQPYAKEHHKRLLGSKDTGRDEARLPEIQTKRRAMMLYTSGTTGQPKGVVTTHANIEAQISSLIQAWGWHTDDHILNVLPLHHVHGIINVTCCALWSGARVTFMLRFSASGIFETFLTEEDMNVFMAVPTIYYKLITAFNSLSAKQQTFLSARMKQFRLMISGSAALPVSVMEQWEELSGQRLLERYGMTEIGMAISNPYGAERRAGHIGQPLPGMQVRLVEDDGAITDEGPGQIQVKGPAVFNQYWRRPDVTKKSFTHDGWFETGDVAELKDGYFRILGRNSVDIIKSGGYKISALEIEEVLRKHEVVDDVAVVGIPSEEWGEIVAAYVITNTKTEQSTLDTFLADKLPRYKRPSRYLFAKELPRNAMGKVMKPAVKTHFV
ncbi:MAG: acyl-CoA synthetase [Saprospiraceae bacterium]